MELQKEIAKKIKKNNNFLEDINQILHNRGIEFSARYNLIKDVLFSKVKDKEIENILFEVSIDKSEIFQKIFMFFGSKYFKKQLDQYYTPITIGKFITDILIPNKKAIDPACGTGELINSYNGKITLIDKSDDVLELTRFNLSNEKSTILEMDTIENHDFENNTYDYVILNPPFGNKTVCTDEDVLEKYELGKGEKSQELGLMFIERAINLLKKNGICFIIVPNGYLGNITSSCMKMRELVLDNRLLGIVNLPDGTFSRSGTGVSTSIMIVQKTKMKNNYEIFIENVENIGYILNKKNTPFKYKTDEDGEYICEKSNPVLLNDLTETLEKFKNFNFKNKINQLIKVNNKKDYEFVMLEDLVNNIFDVKRYLNKYLTTIQHALYNDFVRVKDLIIDVNFKDKLTEKSYYYIDISAVNSPLYQLNKYNKVNLPSRAKYVVKNGDILVSKLKGNISFTIISSDKNNIIVSNGFIVLRPKDELSKILIFGNLFKKSFKIQHQSLTTGSIMETISDEDIKNILLSPNIDNDKYLKIIESVNLLNNELIYNI